MPDKQKVKTYADGRICVPTKILRQYAKESGKGVLPPKIWILKPQGSGVITLQWDNPLQDEAQAYDLSVRDRVLFGRFSQGAEFDVEISKRGIKIILDVSVYDQGETLSSEDEDYLEEVRGKSSFERKVLEHLFQNT